MRFCKTKWVKFNFTSLSIKLFLPCWVMQTLWNTHVSNKNTDKNFLIVTNTEPFQLQMKFSLIIWKRLTIPYVRHNAHIFWKLDKFDIIIWETFNIFLPYIYLDFFPKKTEVVLCNVYVFKFVNICHFLLFWFR